MDAINPNILIGSNIKSFLDVDKYKLNAYSPKRIIQTIKSKN
jgi:hypothetical protein